MRTLADGIRRDSWSSRLRAVLWRWAGIADAVFACRRARPDWRPAHRRACRHRWDNRLVLLSAVRLSERFRGHPRRRSRRTVPYLPGSRRLEFETAVPAGHQCSDYALPDARGSGGSAGLHATTSYT